MNERKSYQITGCCLAYMFRASLLGCNSLFTAAGCTQCYCPAPLLQARDSAAVTRTDRHVSARCVEPAEARQHNK